MRLKSPFHVGYLDDVSLGGPVESLVGDISIIKQAVNIGRVSDGVDQLTCSSVLPGAQSILPSSVCFLGSPIGDINHVSSVICEKIGFLCQLGERLRLFSVHDSILLLLNSFAIPRLIFLLRSSPAFQSPLLQEYDSLLCSLLSTLLNVNISTNCSAWSLASLPIRKGGLGFRSAVQLGPSCYLSSSAAASADLVDLLLTHSCTHTSTVSQSLVQEAKSLWSRGLPPIDPPSGGDASVQKAWDDPVVEWSFDSLVASAPDDLSRARLLAVSAPESGAWLQVLLVSSLGVRLDDSVMRVCVALRLGLATCVLHSCCNCSAAVNRLGHHGFVCKKGGGRHRHAAVNDVIHCALAAAGVSSHL